MLFVAQASNRAAWVGEQHEELPVAEDFGPASPDPWLDADSPVAAVSWACRAGDSPPSIAHAASLDHDFQGSASVACMHAEPPTAVVGSTAIASPPAECTAAPAPSKRVLAEIAAVTGIKRRRFGIGHQTCAESEQYGVDHAEGDMCSGASSEDVDVRNTAISQAYVTADNMPSDNDYWVCILHSAFT
jgi:hypothetical protein